MEREAIGSSAYNIENERVYRDEEIRENVVSYLSEYRLRVKKYDYELVFSTAPGEGFMVRDVHRGEAMNAKAKRTLEERQVKGLPIHREFAELLGLESLDEQLLSAADGDHVFWMSPPGPKEEGYGNYGFVYEGRVQEEVSESGVPIKHLFMTAIRVENPTISQSNKALSELTGENVSYINAEEFLGNPRVVKNVAVNTDDVLRRNFSFVVDQKEVWINKRVITEMDSMINEFVGVIHSGSRAEKITAFYALENYALELKERYIRKQEKREDDTVIYMNEHRRYQYLADIYSPYGYRPPSVAGSCGPTGEETRSNDIFANSYRNLMKAIFGDLHEMFGLEEESDWFNCPKCGYQATGPIGDACPGMNCGLTKTNAKEQGFEACA